MGFSDMTLVLLTSAGWSEDYRADITQYEKTLEEQGYVVHFPVKFFLKLYGGIRLAHPNRDDRYDLFHFDPIRAVSRTRLEDITELYSKRIKSELCVIGECRRGHMTLMMDSDGKVYGGYDEFMAYIGASGEDAIEALCTNRKMSEIPE